MKEDVTGNMEMYKNVKGGGRVAWLDNVKMYAMLWVILGHVMTIVIKTNVDLSGRVMEHFIVAFNMPLFVMLSDTPISMLLIALWTSKGFGTSLRKVRYASCYLW